MRKYSKFSILILLLPCLTSCNKVIKEETVISTQEVENAIQKQLPLGSSATDVNTFLDNLRGRAAKLKYFNYEIGVPSGSDRPDDPELNVRGYIIAVIPDAELVHRPLFINSFWLRMIFYFDDKERLISHKLYMMGRD